VGNYSVGSENAVRSIPSRTSLAGTQQEQKQKYPTLHLSETQAEPSMPVAKGPTGYVDVLMISSKVIPSN